MGQLKIVCAQLGPIDTNTYILMDDEIKEAIIIDPAGSPEEQGLCHRGPYSGRTERAGHSLKRHPSGRYLDQGVKSHKREPIRNG